MMSLGYLETDLLSYERAKLFRHIGRKLAGSRALIIERVLRSD